MTGSTFYPSFGIAGFTDAVQVDLDNRLRDDGHGIVNNGFSASVPFSEWMSKVNSTWAMLAPA